MADRTQTDPVRMEKIVSLCKRKGFIFQAAEIYGGLNGCWDYGPLGVELKRNLKDYWWRVYVQERPDVVGMDGSILTHNSVLVASGHVGGFSDPLCDCLLSKERLRADQIPAQSGVAYWWKGAAAKDGSWSSAKEFSMLTAEGTEKEAKAARRSAQQYYSQISGKNIPLADIELAEESTETVTDSTRYNPSNGSLVTEARSFNLMFKTTIGATSDENDPSSIGWLRPETAQSIFCQYKNVLDSSRMKIPFGIAQIGKSFRNEINPRNFTFRSREFEQMEVEYFCRAEMALPSRMSGWSSASSSMRTLVLLVRRFIFWMYRRRSVPSIPRRHTTWSTSSPSACRSSWVLLTVRTMTWAATKRAPASRWSTLTRPRARSSFRTW